MVQSPVRTNSPETVDTAPRSDGSLGIFTVVSIILLLWGFCWLKNYSVWRRPQMITVAFSDVAGLNNNADVCLDGIRLGAVDQMQWQGTHRVLVKLRVNDAHIVVPTGARFEILPNGIVGAKYVQISMPLLQPGSLAPPPLNENIVVQGEDPVRIEVAMNKVAAALEKIDMDKVGRNYTADRNRLMHVVDRLAILADKSIPLVDRALPLETDLDGLTKDMSRTSRKISKLVDNPHISSNVKEIAAQAHETVQLLKETMHELNQTLGDKPLRKDILQSFQQLNQSTANISRSLESLQNVVSDTQLRGDLLKILHQTHSILDQVDQITSKPMSGDVKGTIHETHEAASHLNLAAEQINQILSKRHPLFHLMFGRPGYIKGPGAPSADINKQPNSQNGSGTTQNTNTNRTQPSSQADTPQVPSQPE
jgi:ABC-type transporter Mla subunit MlaD